MALLLRGVAQAPALRRKCGPFQQPLRHCKISRSLLRCPIVGAGLPRDNACLFYKMKNRGVNPLLHLFNNLYGNSTTFTLRNNRPPALEGIGVVAAIRVYSSPANISISDGPTDSQATRSSERSRAQLASVTSFALSVSLKNAVSQSLVKSTPAPFRRDANATPPVGQTCTP
jgi:hypothetical protein